MPLTPLARLTDPPPGYLLQRKIVYVVYVQGASPAAVTWYTPRESFAGDLDRSLPHVMPKMLAA